MKTLSNILGWVTLISIVGIIWYFGLVGCTESTESDPPQTIDGIVVETTYIPSYDQSDIDVGLTLDLDLTIIPRHTHIPEHHIVVVKADNIDKIKFDDKALYEQSSVGDKIKIVYRSERTSGSKKLNKVIKFVRIANGFED